MALTKCFECGHEVSTSAIACPNCGAPVKHAITQAIPAPVPPDVPPPIPATNDPPMVATPPPIPNVPPLPVILPGTPPVPSAPPAVPAHRDKAVLRMFVVPGLGLLGAFFDLYVGWTVLRGIESVRSDFQAFAAENPLVVPFLRLLFPDIDSNTTEAAAVFGTAAAIMLLCGLIGGIASLLFVAGRFTKILALGLIVCGIAPMFHHSAEFMGLPMALAGLLGLLMRDKMKAQ
jgi:hypothetical protein